MRLPGRKLVRRGGRWIRSRLGQRGIILGYHSIADDPWDPFGLRVSVSNFREHVEVLRGAATPLPLSSLVESASRRSIPPGAVAITFDDGYVDGVRVVKPLLADGGVPATFFVVSGALGGEFWWDALARALHPEVTLPEQVVVPRRGAAPLQFRPGHGPAARRQSLARLQRVLQPLDPEERDHLMACLRDTLGPSAAGMPVHRCVDSDEAAELHVPGFLEIGSHGHTHQPLADLSGPGRHHELARSRVVLEDITGAPVSSFSFPHGSFPDGATDLLEEHGFRRACVSTPDVVRWSSSPLGLPRFWVPNVGGADLARWLRRWL